MSYKEAAMKQGHAVYSTKTKILRGVVWILMLILALFMVFPKILNF